MKLITPTRYDGRKLWLQSFIDKPITRKKPTRAQRKATTKRRKLDKTIINLLRK